MSNRDNLINLIERQDTDAILSMSRRDLMAIAANCPARHINDEAQHKDRPYFERFYVCTHQGNEYYLHRFLQAPVNEFLHDHPFHGRSLILRGSYRETRLMCLNLPALKTRDYTFKRGDSNRIGADDFHSIREIEPETWTLFIAGPRIKGWGFIEEIDGGFKYTNPHGLAASDWHTGAPLGKDIMRPLTKGIDL